MDRNTIQKILIGLFLSACILLVFEHLMLLDLTKSTKPEVVQMLVVQE
jgi:hypothetical protein